MILYITRKYPPSVGGMQRLSADLAGELGSLIDLQIIAWGSSQLLLPIFVVYAFGKAAFLLAIKRCSVASIHLGDPVLAPLGLLLKLLFQVPVSANAHGLDVIYPNAAYQRLFIACLRRLDLVVCISEAARRECIQRNVPSERCVVIPIGIKPVEDPVDRDEARRAVSRRFNLDVGKKKLLLTVGRLVRRKGVAYFVDAVLPDIVRSDPDVLYLVPGKGPELDKIKDTVTRRGLHSHVFLLGAVSKADLAMLYAAADVFVMPNVQVAGDLEGFGIVALESSAAGLWVVAFDVDGISSAIVHGMNGWLIRPGDSHAMARAVVDLLADDICRRELGAKGSAFTLANFSWPPIAHRYCDEFRKLRETVESIV